MSPVMCGRHTDHRPRIIRLSAVVPTAAHYIDAVTGMRRCVLYLCGRAGCVSVQSWSSSCSRRDTSSAALCATKRRLPRHDLSVTTEQHDYDGSTVAEIKCFVSSGAFCAWPHIRLDTSALAEGAQAGAHRFHICSPWVRHFLGSWSFGMRIC